MLYVIVQQGMYRHQIKGVSDKESMAYIIADEAANTDDDDFHRYDVIECEKDKLIEDGKVVYSARKNIPVEPMPIRESLSNIIYDVLPMRTPLNSNGGIK